MTNSLIQKLERRDRLSDDEKQVLDRAIARVREVEEGQAMVEEGSRPTTSTLLLEGIAGRCTYLKDGKRQITALHVAGDFVDLHGFLLKTMDHAVLALSPCRIAVVPHDILHEITNSHPHLTRLLWLSTLIDAATHRTWIVAMGRLSSLGQMAHLFCELFVRLQAVGLTRGYRYRLSLTQSTLGDVLGLSAVHVNRILQELRGRALIGWQNNELEIKDWDRLREVAEFDPTYLSLHNEAR